MKITKQQLESSLNDGKSMNDISKEFGVSLTSIRYWCKKFSLQSQYGNFKEVNNKTKKSYKKGGFKNLKIEVDESHLDYNNWSEQQEEAYSYLLGFYLGDGCLQHDIKRKTRSYTFMISNQRSFTRMNQEIVHALQILFPNKTVKFYNRKKSDCINIKLTAINLNLLFPHGRGLKHTRKIELANWQEKMIEKYPKEFIKGIIESDGCRFAPRKKQCPSYIIYQFTNCSLDIHLLLQKFAKQIGLNFTFRERKNIKLKYRTPAYLTCFNDKKSFEILESFIGPKN